jgi:GNAT superfamily N-acetyltransferase
MPHWRYAVLFRQTGPYVLPSSPAWLDRWASCDRVSYVRGLYEHRHRRDSSAIARASRGLHGFLRGRGVQRQPEMVLLLLPMLLRGSFEDPLGKSDGRGKPRVREQSHRSGSNARPPRISGRPSSWLVQCSPARVAHVLDAEPIPHPEQVGTILCFVVAPRIRGQGVATALLNAACQHLTAQGLRFVEANPRTNAKGAAENHFGFLGMYLVGVHRAPNGQRWQRVGRQRVAIHAVAIEFMTPNPSVEQTSSSRHCHLKAAAHVEPYGLPLCQGEMV